MFDPTSNGTTALHCVVPVVPTLEAVPDPPVFVAQVTDATPTLSVAVPLNAIDAVGVDTDVEAGTAIVSDGGVVSDDEPVEVGVVPVPVPVDVPAACVRVIAADCET